MSKATMKVSTVTEDLRKMLGSAPFCDMRFICSDGQELPALRMLVAARCPVLHSMLLTSGMAESRLERVHLPGIAGSAMLVCLEFLYTDHVDAGSWPKPLDEAMGVAAAARFLLIPGLETQCVDHLAVVLRHIEAPSSVLAGEIIRAYSIGVELYDDPRHEDLAILLKKFTKSVRSALNRSFDGYKLLSERGCLHLLRDLEADAFSLREYHLLVLAIRWCASRVLLSDSSLEEDNLLENLDALFPSSNARLHSALKKDRNLFAAASKSPFIKKLADPLARFLEKASIDLSRVPLPILCTFFEPLQIIPCSKLLAAYRVHALSRPRLRWDFFYLHKNYAVSELDSNEILCSEASHGFEGFAAFNMCTSVSKCRISEWEILMLEPCENLRYGFCIVDGIQYPVPSQGMHLLGNTFSSVALGSDGAFYTNIRGIPDRTVRSHQKRICVTKGTTLGMRIDFGKGQFSFKVDGVTTSYSISLEDSSEVYPAISMEKPGKARFQMVLQE